MEYLQIYQTENGETQGLEIPEPEYIDVLLNTNEVAVDGVTYENVTQVRMTTKEP